MFTRSKKIGDLKKNTSLQNWIPGDSSHDLLIQYWEVT